MKSRLIIGKIHHQRVVPVAHGFTYPMAACCFDLDELETLQNSLSFFRYNRKGLISLHDDDYLSNRSGSIGSRLRGLLQEAGLGEDFQRFELVTVPRVLFKVFNPVSFFLCYRADGELAAAVSEVHNTFGEVHLYVLGELTAATAPGFLTAKCCKEFHVSPFNDMKGEYRFYFSVNADHLDIRVNIRRDGRTVFTSRVSGTPQPLQSALLLANFGRLAFAAHAAMPRIMWEAAKLRFSRGLPVYTKPIAHSAMTIRRAGPGTAQRLCLNIALRFLRGFQRGHLTLSFPDGSNASFGDAKSDLKATLFVKNYDLFVKSIVHGDIGFGEAFIKGYWETDDLTALLTIFAENWELTCDLSLVSSYLGRMLNVLLHRVRNNSKRRSKKNIRSHYDLSNELFKHFLDPTMTYSCARFESADDTLEQAQLNKLRAMIQKARISGADHVLEIGSGWGSFAIEAARATGCRVTSITLSPEQQQLARQRVQDAGLSDRVAIELCDYRDVKGQYDKIVSIEMLEAVGHQYLGTFFKTCDGLLKDNGLLVLQFITIPDQRYEAYRRGCDFIQKYIFPGGHCPSLSAVAAAAKRHSGFIVEDLENIGVHYARTLSEWRLRFLRNLREISGLGFDEEFQRIWNYYLSYCEAGFATRSLDTLQMVLTRPNNKALSVSDT